MCSSCRLAASRGGRRPASLILLAAVAGATLGSSLLYFVVRRGGWFLAKEWQLLVTTVDVDLEDVAEVIVLAVLVATGVGVVIRRSRAASTPLHLQ